MEQPSQVVCSICHSGSHNVSSCPELYDPLKEGFYSGGGGGSHSHEEDDEAIYFRFFNAFEYDFRFDVEVFFLRV